MAYSLSDSFCTKFNVFKPFLPYYPGQQFTVVSHDPPEPTKGSCALNIHTAREGIGTTAVYLKILEPVRLGDNHMDRVIPHESNSPPVDTPLIAKFYDPLYFDHEQDDADPFLCVDRDYSHVAAAYKALSVLQRSTIPIYYGSYSMELPAEATVRSVRLILMEFIPGSSMQQLKPSDFSPVDRQVIMKAVVDAESLVYTLNVRDRDIHPRNILVLTTATATLGSYPHPEDPETEARYLPGVPISPLLRWNVAWWRHRQAPFSEWVDWDWQSWLEHNYGTIDSTAMGYMIKIWLPSWLTKPLPPPPTGGGSYSGDSDESSDDSDEYSE
ncbi:hypothetical protein V1525DRAFT_452899 [Lipomyces kononenkoae]|uniref:Uncharacterized protein n=1 Tax=Lipomyces kononenkoae TaxID=34357 RepID=A0ACC3SR02_LIPKO